jgi:hypothetical protein
MWRNCQLARGTNDWMPRGNQQMRLADIMEEIECDDGIGNEAIPLGGRVAGGSGVPDRNEVFLEGTDGALGGVAAVGVGGSELEVNAMHQGCCFSKLRIGNLLGIFSKKWCTLIHRNDPMFSPQSTECFLNPRLVM